MKTIFCCVLAFITMINAGGATLTSTSKQLSLTAGATSATGGASAYYSAVGVDPGPIKTNIEAAAKYAAKVGETGFDSPEAAAAAYLEALRDADLPRMMQAFAIGRYMENFNFLEFMQVSGYYNISEGFENINAYAEISNVESRKKSVVNSITSQYFALCQFESGQDALQPVTRLVTEVEIDEFYNWLCEYAGAPDLSSIKILGFLNADYLADIGARMGIDDFSRVYNQQTKDRMDKKAGAFGADRSADCIAVIEISGKNYLCFLETYEYNGKWLISNLDGTLSKTVRSILQLDQDLFGLLPLFHVSIYTAASPEEVIALNAAIRLLMVKYQGGGQANLPAAAQIKDDPPGYDSPEGAVAAYFEAFRDADADRAYSIFAYENIIKNYDIKTAITASNFYHKGAAIKFPPVNGLAISLNEEGYKIKIPNFFISHYMNLCDAETEVIIDIADKIDTEEDAVRMLELTRELLNASNPGALQVLGFVPIDRLGDLASALGGLELSDNFFKDGRPLWFDELAKTAGAEEASACITVLYSGKDLYLSFIDTVKYNGTWYINADSYFSNYMSVTFYSFGLTPLSMLADSGLADIDQIFALMSPAP